MWKTKYKIFLGICFVHYVEEKNAFTIQPTKFLVSTNVKSAQPAVMSLETKTNTDLNW